MGRAVLRFERVARPCQCHYCETFPLADRWTARYIEYGACSRGLTRREVAWLIGHILGSLRGREEW